LESTKVVILDTCYSGGFGRYAQLQARGISLNDSAVEPPKVPEGASSRDLNRAGYVTLTACDDDVAYESSFLENGVFTYYLVEGLGPDHPADSNSNGAVSAEEVFSYASPRTTKLIPIQHPQIFDGVSGEVQLTNVSITTTIGDIATTLRSAENTVYFIYPDYSGAKPPGVSPALLSDWTAIGFMIGMCSNRQYEVTDTNPTVIDTSSGMAKLQDKTIVLFGGPLVNAPVHYYEGQRLAPLYWQMDNDVCYWYKADGTRLDETALPSSQLASQDMFLLEAFIDNSGNKVFIFYGYGWKGTFATGKFVKFIIYPNISSYTHAYYIFKWVDGNGDGFVDLDEIMTTPIASG